MRSLVLVLLLMGVRAGAETRDATVPLIHVTRTWGDLVKTPPIEGLPASPSSSPTRVWVGIDRNQVGSHGVALLYCLTRGSLQPSGQFGPFDVRIFRPPMVNDLPKLAKALMKRAELRYTLYVFSIVVQDPGLYVIELRSPSRPGDKTESHLFARTKLDVFPPVSPWVAWGSSNLSIFKSGASQATPEETAIQSATTAVSNPAGGIAIPRLSEPVEDGMGISFKNLPPSGQPLPDLIPSSPDPDTRLKMERDTLIVTLKTITEPGSSPFSSWDRQFLTRWWVNDQPFRPALDSNSHDISGWSYKGRQPATEARFRLDFRPEPLGAVKGDKIGVQLLYCPEGWDQNGTSFSMERDEGGGMIANRDLNQPPPEITYLSNCLDFIYSGDPKNPQAMPAK